jgi:hypothetical protein
MVAMRVSFPNPPFRLDSDTLTITGVPSGKADWYEFEVVSNGVPLGHVGGQAKSEFTKSMLAVIENTELSSAQFLELSSRIS